MLDRSIMFFFLLLYLLVQGCLGVLDLFFFVLLISRRHFMSYASALLGHVFAPQSSHH